MKNLGRNIKIIVILLIVISGLAWLVGAIIKKSMNYEDEISVYVYADNIDKGEEFDQSNINLFIKEILINKSDVPPNAILDISNLSGLYIQENVYENEFVTKNTIDAKYPFQVEYEIPDGHSLVSVRFDQGDAANAWNVFEGQEVNLVYTPSASAILNESMTATMYDKDQLLNGTIYSIKDSQFKVAGEANYDPAKLLYITFLVKREDAIFISRVKDKGRLDIIQ